MPQRFGLPCFNPRCSMPRRSALIPVLIPALIPALYLAALLLSAPAPATAAGEAEAPAAAGKRAFEITDYYRTAFAEAPVVSPDGSRLAFSVTRYDFEGGERWSEIWLMAADGSAQRQMTRGRHGDTSPLFSPDGSRLYFLSDRSGASQLHVIPVDGGEPRQLTRFAPGLSDPVLSPDGRFFAVTAQVYPECGADGGCTEELATDAAEGRLNVHVADELLYRHWDHWRDGRSRHILLVDAAGGEVVRDLTPGPWDSPVFSVGGPPGYAFSPDGSELTYASNREADQATTTNADLWRLDLTPVVSPGSEGGELAPAVNLTAANKGWDGAPLYSPDGRHLAYLSQETPGYESDLFRLALHDRETGATRFLTDRRSFDDFIDALAWAPGSDALYFQAQVEGRTPLFRLDLPAAEGAEPSIEHVLTHAYLQGWQLSPGGETLFYTRRSIGEPHEVFRAPAAGGEPRRLTHFNAALEAEVELRPAEELWVNGAGDYEVHVFLIKPHGFDPAERYPLILNVHGGPHNQWADAYRGDWQVYPGKGYAVAFANPTGSAGYGQDFTDAISCDWGGRVFEDLMRVADALEKLPWVDPERMGAMGWSYGGYMMNWFAGHTDRFQALASMMGIYDLEAFYGATEELWFPEYDLCGTPWTSEHYRRWDPSASAQRLSTPTLILTGERDYRVPYTQSLMFFTALRRQDVPARLIVFPEAGHWPSWYEMAFYYNAHLDWFHRWLGGEPAPWDVEAMARNQVFEEGKYGE